MPAVVIARRHLDRHVDDAEFFVGAHLRPHAGVASVGGGVRIPGVVARFAFHRDGVEDPHALAGADIEAADVALDVSLAARCAAFAVGGANHDHVLGDDRRGMQADLGVLEIDALLVEARLQVDDAASTERGDAGAGLGVERHHLVTGRHVDDAFFLAVAPVGQAATRQLARRGFTALALFEAVHPLHLARCRVQRHGGAAGAGRGVEHAVDHQGRRLELELGARPEVLSLESERQLQFGKIRGVDLIEWGIPGGGEVAAICRPLADLGRRLSARRHRGHSYQQHQDPGAHHPAG